MRGRLAAAQHVSRLLLERARPLGRRDDHGAAAVRDQANVADREGIAHHARRQHVLDRQRFLVPGDGIELRPFARGHRHRCQLLARCAVLMHMARRRHGVGARRHERVERRLVGVDLAHRRLLAADAALRAAVGDDGHIAQPLLDGAHGVRDVILERRTADDGRADERRVDAQIFAQRQHRQPALRRGAEHAVDILERQAAILERPLDALCHQVDDGESVGHVAQIGFGDADDRRAAALQAVH